MISRALAVSICFFATVVWCTEVLQPPFSHTLYASTALHGRATDMEWAPDGSGRLFVASKDGTVRIVKDGIFRPTPFVTITLALDQYECGLVGMCFDPNFLRSGYVYFFVTVSTTEQRIIRYEAEGDVGVNKVDLISNLPTIGELHNGGGIAFGPDGNLYWGVGDLSTGAGANEDLVSLAAKIGRARPDGTPVKLNPFYDGAGPNNDYIWARGFRNPFKLIFQEATGALWVNVAGFAYEQVFLINRGDHAGWYNYESNQPPGYASPKIKYRTNSRDVRDLTPEGAVRQDGLATFTTQTRHGFLKGERLSIRDVSDDTFNRVVYVESIPSATVFTARQDGGDAVSGGGTAVTLNDGGAVTAGCFYNATQFPAEYHGNYFFGDFNTGSTERALLDGSNEVTAITPFIRYGPQSIVDLTLGPDGALYFLVWPGRVYRSVATNTPQTLVVSPTALFMREGGASVVNISLANMPTNDVVVSIARSSGVTITTTNTSLTFTPLNYSVPQPVYLEASADADPYSSRAEFVVSRATLDDQLIKILASDADSGALRFTSVAQSNSVTRLEIAAERYMAVAVDGSADLLSWTRVTNQVATGESVTVLDTGTNSPRRQFYRAFAGP